MIHCQGSITVNGITDSELVRILEIKIKHEGKFSFNPQQLQVIQIPNRNNQPQTAYNNALFIWNNEAGLEAVSEVIDYLIRKEERVAA